MAVSNRGVVELTLNPAGEWPAYISLALAVLVAVVALGRSVIAACVGLSQRNVRSAPPISSRRSAADRSRHGVGGRGAHQARRENQGIPGCSDPSAGRSLFQRRARTVSRSKLHPEVVRKTPQGRGRKLPGEVDESGTGSTNFWTGLPPLDNARPSGRTL